MPYEANSRHEIWASDARYINHPLPGTGNVCIVSILEKWILWRSTARYRTERNDARSWLRKTPPARDAFGAFLESFGRRTPGRNLVSREKLAARPLAAVEAGDALRLVDLTGPGLARIGATGAISTDAREKAQAWSRALHLHPSGPVGLRYRLRHDPSRNGVAIFERAGELRASPLGTLLAPGKEKLLAEILGEYRFGLVGGPASS